MPDSNRRHGVDRVVFRTTGVHYLTNWTLDVRKRISHQTEACLENIFLWSAYEVLTMLFLQAQLQSLALFLSFALAT